MDVKNKRRITCAGLGKKDTDGKIFGGKNIGGVWQRGNNIKLQELYWLKD